MDLTHQYHMALEKIRKGSRAFLTLSEEELSLTKKALTSPKQEENQMALCLVNHLFKTTSTFDQELYQLLESDHPKTLIFTLSACSRHIIQHHQKRGERAPKEFLFKLKALFEKNSDPEVLEWLLRLTEELGTQSLFLKEPILKRKPSFLKLFNKHHLASHQIINLLESRWKQWMPS